jgi:hypothetical protein
MAPGGRLRSEAPIKDLRSLVGGIGLELPSVVVLPTDVYFLWRASTAPEGDDWRTWSTTPIDGDMLLSVMVANHPTLTPPAGWSTIGSGSTAGGSWKAAAATYTAGVGRFWAAPSGGAGYPAEGVMLFSYRLTGMSGLTWQTPTVSTYTTSTMDTSGPTNYEASIYGVPWQSVSWPVRMQAIMVAGSQRTTPYIAPTSPVFYRTTSSGSTSAAALLAPGLAVPGLPDITTQTPQSGAVDFFFSQDYAFNPPPRPVAFSLGLGAA